MYEMKYLNFIVIKYNAISLVYNWSYRINFRKEKNYMNFYHVQHWDSNTMVVLWTSNTKTQDPINSVIDLVIPDHSDFSTWEQEF